MVILFPLYACSILSDFLFVKDITCGFRKTEIIIFSINVLIYLCACLLFSFLANFLVLGRGRMKTFFLVFNYSYYTILKIITVSFFFLYSCREQLVFHFHILCTAAFTVFYVFHKYLRISFHRVYKYLQFTFCRSSHSHFPGDETNTV